ncbi:MAG: hypothetical protein NVSMB51_08120 [Solirubrobacteraceae bacterium]
MAAMKTCVVAAVGLLALTAPSLAAGHRGAVRPASVTPGSRYLALGDSVTFGFQEPQVVPAPDYFHAASFLGYPEQLATELHLKVTNTSCPGETSASLLDPTAPSNGCENAYRKNFPLHASYAGAQLSYAVAYLRKHRDIGLVTLMIGANDLFLCQRSTKDACTNPSEQQAVLSNNSRNVKRTLSEIRNTAHYRGQLAIVNYYSLNYSSSFINGILTALNNSMDSATRPFHVVIADGFAELQAGARNSGGDLCAAGLLNQTGGGKCGVHPTYAGQALLAQALEKAIRVGR